MSAKTPWWYCGKCGFANHPRTTQDETKCEQCGASSDCEFAIDYRPTGA